MNAKTACAWFSMSLFLVGCPGAGDQESSAPAGARFPFPQNQPSAYCTYPASADPADAQAAYDIWKSDLVTPEGAGGFLRVRRPDTPDGIPNSTVSEGIAYGMILAVYMNDQDVFDKLWQYAKLWADSRGLMQWYIDPAGTQACPGETSCGSASDSDEDMAWALVMADRQWGGKGSLEDTYLNDAKQHIEAIRKYDVEPGTYILKPGDSWGGYSITNPSYFAPAYYRVFGEISSDTVFWNSVIDANYQVIANSLNTVSGNADNGLVPAWCDGEGTPHSGIDLPGHFQYDSARTPFRIGQDYCYHGEPRAKSYLDKINSFFTQVGAANIIDGYELDGTSRPEASQEGSRSAVFVGCAGVGAMSDSANQPFIDQTYALVATLELLVRSRYYQRSWTAMSLLMMTGNFIDYTKMQ